MSERVTVHTTGGIHRGDDERSPAEIVDRVSSVSLSYDERSPFPCYEDGDEDVNDKTMFGWVWIAGGWFRADAVVAVIEIEA